jgi:hypothetical protein
MNFFSSYSKSSNTSSKIDTNSKQYKALKKTGMLDTVIQSEMAMTPQERLIYEVFGGRDTIIRNMMKLFDEDGDMLNTNGVAGMLATGIPESERHQIIDVSEEYRQKMFDMVKREFTQEKGIANGDTTKRSDVYTAYQLSIKKEDRLKGTWTLEQYETQYWVAMYDAVKAANPNWQPGRIFDSSVLNGITREMVESTLEQKGNTFVQKSIDISV